MRLLSFDSRKSTTTAEHSWQESFTSLPWGQFCECMQNSHSFLSWLCRQSSFPSQSLQRSFRRPCAVQSDLPPHSLHSPLRLLCIQMPEPPHSLHFVLCLLCSQIEAPLQSLHSTLLLSCSQIPGPPQSLQQYL